MILYHGSNVEIEAIDFSKSKPGKDFGVGFYLSPDENQALEMAEKKARLLGGAPIVTRYEFDEEAVKADSVAYLRYEKYSLEWGQFVKELEHKGGETYQYFFGTERSLKYLRKL